MRSALLMVIVLTAACAAQPAPSAHPASATASLNATAAPTLTPAAAATVSPSPFALPTVPPTPIPLPTNVQLSVPSGTVVWALVAGTHLFRSVDRGDTWQERAVPPFAMSIQVSFVSDREGWLLSGSPGSQCPLQSIKIGHTTDGAATWSEMATAGIEPAHCKDGMSFVSSTTGFVSASDQAHASVLYRTIDGGTSWDPTRPLPDPPGVSGQPAVVGSRTGPVHAFGSTLLLPLARYDLSTQATFVYRSLDDGASWAYRAKLPSSGWSPQFITATRWVQLLVPGQSQETTDAGTTWHPYSSDYGQAAPVAPQVEFGDPQIGYATVRGSIQRTLDGAAHWTRIRTPGTG